MMHRKVDAMISRTVFQSGVLLLAVGVGMAMLGMAAHAGNTSSPSGGLPIAYTPPDRGAPVTRIAGTVRGPRADAPLKIMVLVPPRTALSDAAEPTLYWYISADQPAGIEAGLTITNEDTFDTVLDHAIAGPLKAGVQRIALADLGFRLEPGVEYQWNVSVVRDPSQRSGDLVAAGGILHRPWSAVAPVGDPAKAAAAYARNGYWYDALDLLVSARDNDTEAQKIAVLERALLEQVGLSDVAQTR